MADRLVAFLVNFNRRDLLLRAIASLQAQTRRPDRVLVIDNGSTDDSVVAARALGDERVRIVELGENLGSSGGFHRGVVESLADGATHILVLDSDVVLAVDTIEHLADALGRDPRLGAVGPKVYHWDSATLLQELGGWIDWDQADLRRSHWRHDEARLGRVTTDQSVDYVPACCLLATHAAFVAAGNFDPGWFLYWDDIDWCQRVLVAGFGIAVVASARVQHFGGGANKRNLVPVYYGWRNRLTFFRLRTPGARGEATMRAFASDYLLARFTCETLGLTKTAAVMQLGVDDALAGVFARKDFSGVDVSLDSPAAPPPAVEPTERVHHVIASATAAMAARPGLYLLDRFGKQLPAARAWELRQRFESDKMREIEGLLARARAPNSGA